MLKESYSATIAVCLICIGVAFNSFASNELVPLEQLLPQLGSMGHYEGKVIYNKSELTSEEDAYLWFVRSGVMSTRGLAEPLYFTNARNHTCGAYSLIGLKAGEGLPLGTSLGFLVETYQFANGTQMSAKLEMVQIMSGDKPVVFSEQQRDAFEELWWTKVLQKDLEKMKSRGWGQALDPKILTSIREEMARTSNQPGAPVCVGALADNHPRLVPLNVGSKYIQ